MTSSRIGLLEKGKEHEDDASDAGSSSSTETNKHTDLLKLFNDTKNMEKVMALGPDGRAHDAQLKTVQKIAKKNYPFATDATQQQQYLLFIDPDAIPRQQKALIATSALDSQDMEFEKAYAELTKCAEKLADDMSIQLQQLAGFLYVYSSNYDGKQKYLKYLSKEHRAYWQKLKDNTAPDAEKVEQYVNDFNDTIKKLAELPGLPGHKKTKILSNANVTKLIEVEGADADGPVTKYEFEYASQPTPKKRGWGGYIRRIIEVLIGSALTTKIVGIVNAFRQNGPRYNAWVAEFDKDASILSWSGGFSRTILQAILTYGGMWYALRFMQNLITVFKKTFWNPLSKNEIIKILGPLEESEKKQLFPENPENNDAEDNLSTHIFTGLTLHEQDILAESPLLGMLIIPGQRIWRRMKVFAPRALTFLTENGRLSLMLNDLIWFGINAIWALNGFGALAQAGTLLFGMWFDVGNEMAFSGYSLVQKQVLLFNMNKQIEELKSAIGAKEALIKEGKTALMQASDADKSRLEAEIKKDEHELKIMQKNCAVFCNRKSMLEKSQSDAAQTSLRNLVVASILLMSVICVTLTPIFPPALIVGITLLTFSGVILLADKFGLYTSMAWGVSWVMNRIPGMRKKNKEEERVSPNTIKVGVLLATAFTLAILSITIPPAGMLGVALMGMATLVIIAGSYGFFKNVFGLTAHGINAALSEKKEPETTVTFHARVKTKKAVPALVESAEAESKKQFIVEEDLESLESKTLEDADIEEEENRIAPQESPLNPPGSSSPSAPKPQTPPPDIDGLDEKQTSGRASPKSRNNPTEGATLDAPLPAVGHNTNSLFHQAASTVRDTAHAVSAAAKEVGKTLLKEGEKEYNTKRVTPSETGMSLG